MSVSKRIKLTSSGLFACCPGHQEEEEEILSESDREEAEARELRKGICFLKKVPRDALQEIVEAQGKIEQGTQCDHDEVGPLLNAVAEIEGNGLEMTASNRTSETQHLPCLRVDANADFNGQYPDALSIVFCRLCARGFKTERSLSVHLARKHNEVQSAEVMVDSD